MAELSLKLDNSIKPLPDDSTVLVRPRSALGLKYVELTKGTSSKGYADGATVPLTKARPHPVEIDEFFGMFDDKTRAAERVNLVGFSNALFGRGVDLNIAIQAFNPLLRYLTPVMENLGDPSTRLVPLVQALDRTAAEVAPVAETQADLFKNIAITFGAINRVKDDYQQTIVNSPPALEAAIRHHLHLRTIAPRRRLGGPSAGHASMEPPLGVTAGPGDTRPAISPPATGAWTVRRSRRPSRSARPCCPPRDPVTGHGCGSSRPTPPHLPR